MTRTKSAHNWKGPTIKEIADLSGLGVATVDRVLNGRAGVRNETRARVQAALFKLQHSASSSGDLNITLLCESGKTFNSAVSDAVNVTNRSQPGVSVSGIFAETNQSDPQSLAGSIIDAGKNSDGLVLIAREHPAINHAVRTVCRDGVPVVCLTTDLPSSRRSAYVGNDQYAAGSVAAQLIGQSLTKTRQRILIVMSVAFRCQQEREMGFRRVLRSTYPHLRIDERVIADDAPETTCSQLLQHFEAHGLPPAIYNVAGANRGVAQALEVAAGAETTIFVGHELTVNSQQLLVSGIMDYVISHDFESEVQAAAHWIKTFHEGVDTDVRPTQILVHTRYNCSL